MKLELSGINAHDVDQHAYGPLPEHVVCMVLSFNGGIGTSRICSV